MSLDKFTLNEFAEMMKRDKWYLLEVEAILHDQLRKGYGTITISFDLRADTVEKIIVKSTEETILRPKKGHPEGSGVADEMLTGEFFNVRM